MPSSFSSIPTINYSRLRTPTTKAAELIKLRDAIFVVGFLYLVESGLEPLIKETHEALPWVFSLPTEVKEKSNMRNSPAFLGYTQLGSETTAAQTDLREQFDFGTPVEATTAVNEPQWKKLAGPSQFPANSEVESLVKQYLTGMHSLSRSFLQLVGESLSLPPTTFDGFLGDMDRLKFVKYPPAAPGSQGVGPHKDSTGLFTFLSQDNVGGLEVLNKDGDWIEVSPVEGSLVVNIQQGFEAITGGICGATTHRVIAPTDVTRYSIPFFLGVRLDLTLDQLRESAAHITAKIPVTDDRKKRAVDVPSEFLSPQYSCFGEAQLRNRVLSHPDVGKRWYPDLYEKYSNEVLR
ncbi:Clavaminate synthase-like protein [Lophium mytilinum]|uniref:Clavaminate synthase-like protein n=1 Tax=Lophium mytilinum TaxID=390894 RepID=A0A6A6QRL3_9PEZI|nr:Clavaminate synthase-like protein [Lophium mytilinum]